MAFGVPIRVNGRQERQPPTSTPRAGGRRRFMRRTEGDGPSLGIGCAEDRGDLRGGPEPVARPGGGQRYAPAVRLVPTPCGNGASHVRHASPIPANPLRTRQFPRRPARRLPLCGQDPLHPHVGAGALRLLHPTAALRQNAVADHARRLLRSYRGRRVRRRLRRHRHRQPAYGQPQPLRGAVLRLLGVQAGIADPGGELRQALRAARPRRPAGATGTCSTKTRRAPSSRRRRSTRSSKRCSCTPGTTTSRSTS